MVGNFRYQFAPVKNPKRTILLVFGVLAFVKESARVSAASLAGIQKRIAVADFPLPRAVGFR